ncbi:hypothetical protein, partial [Photorhabdus australis]|uniref:hypothetical protein n=1 Tax=Photorhabdus australis TaxID=286156 RepID=UPI0030DB4A0E
MRTLSLDMPGSCDWLLSSTKVLAGLSLISTLFLPQVRSSLAFLLGRTTFSFAAISGSAVFAVSNYPA